MDESGDSRGADAPWQFAFHWVCYQVSSTRCDRKSCGKNVLSGIYVRMFSMPTGLTAKDHLALAVLVLSVPTS